MGVVVRSLQAARILSDKFSCFRNIFTVYLMADCFDFLTAKISGRPSGVFWGLLPGGRESKG